MNVDGRLAVLASLSGIAAAMVAWGLLAGISAFLKSGVHTKRRYQQNLDSLLFRTIEFSFFLLICSLLWHLVFGPLFRDALLAS